MRALLFSFAFLMVLQAYSQSEEITVISGIVADSDSVPVPDMAIINTHTLNTVRTNENGFFQAQISGNDSLLIYHISFKRRFITKKDNGKLILLEPEINEIKQVNVTADHGKESENLEKTVNDIKRLARINKPSKEEMKSEVTTFVEQNGSHNKGFSPFFGPTISVPIGKIIQLAGLDMNKQKRKKLTSHYHLIKPGRLKKKNKNSKD